jgi:hypothetical protein
MKKTLALLLLSAWISIPAWSEDFSFPVFNWSNDAQITGVIAWTAPASGTVSISGDAWPIPSSGALPAAVYYMPQSFILSYGIDYAIDQFGGNGSMGGPGVIPIAAGTLQSPWVTSSNPAPWGGTSLPLATPGVTLSNVEVSPGDVIAAFVANRNLLTGMNIGMTLNVSMDGDFQPAGAGSGPVDLTGLYDGISGYLDPATGDSTNAYLFYWAGGSFGGNVSSGCVYQGGSSSSEFANGLGVSMSSSSGTPVGNTTVFAGGSCSGDSFSFGTLAPGNYELQLTDLGSGDPPYDVQFNGSIDPPASPSNVTPEPSTLLLLGTGLAGVLMRFRKLSR